MIRWAALLLLAAGLRPDASAVKLLWFGTGWCSAVAVSPTRALTASHCLRHGALEVDSLQVVGHDLGHDLGELAGQFRPPYAQLGWSQPIAVEGFGCDPRVVVGVPFPHRGIRPVREVATTSFPGLEIVLLARVCHGDSGGAVWGEDGRLVGILTAIDGQQPGLGYATTAGPAL